MPINEFYDRDGVHEAYLEHRERPDNPNDAIERPIFYQLAGDLSGLDVIDLGCGDGRFGRDALEQGARSYLGVEVSERMAALAGRNLAGLAGSVSHQAIEAWRAAPASADLVTSRLALNHVEDVASVLRQAHEALRIPLFLYIAARKPITG